MKRNSYEVHCLFSDIIMCVGQNKSLLGYQLTSWQITGWCALHNHRERSSKWLEAHSLYQSSEHLLSTRTWLYRRKQVHLLILRGCICAWEQAHKAAQHFLLARWRRLWYPIYQHRSKCGLSLPLNFFSALCRFLGCGWCPASLGRQSPLPTQHSPGPSCTAPRSRVRCQRRSKKEPTPLALLLLFLTMSTALPTLGPTSSLDHFYH